jgi:paraquat-inducible protein B
MSELNGVSNIPQATIATSKRLRFSVVWIIPIIAALVGIGIAVERFLNEGPTITITFKIAEGIEAGKTFVKYKDVNIGQVTGVNLSDDYSQVVVTAKIAKNAKNLLVKDARFWIMQPRVTLSGVSGMGTLLSGNYIGLEAGKSNEKQRIFKGLDTPPLIKSTEPGRQFLLKADDLGSLGYGSPIYYRRLNVGQVIGYDLAKNGKSVDIKVFVNAPYDKYITAETRFWQASGIDFSMGANGVVIHTQSLASMLAGGIAFDTPLFSQDAVPAPENTAFPLFGDREAATAKHELQADPYVLVFNESVRGLSVGAPVTYIGLEIGEVKQVSFHYDPEVETIKPKVLIVYYPERFLSQFDNRQIIDPKHDKSLRRRQGGLQHLIDRGLRAQLHLGNIVTGQLYIAFDYFPHAPKVKVDWQKDPPQLPVMPSGLAEFQMKVTKILGKIDKIPLEDIGKDTQKAMASLDKTLKDTQKLLGRIDTEIVPEVKTAMENLKRAVAAAERVLVNTDKTLTGPDAPVNQELRDALQEISRAARALKGFAEYMDSHPEALIRGKAQEQGQ